MLQEHNWWNNRNTTDENEKWGKVLCLLSQFMEIPLKYYDIDTIIHISMLTDNMYCYYYVLYTISYKLMPDSFQQSKLIHVNNCSF